jgi:hypothetical protein
MIFNDAPYTEHTSMFGIPRNDFSEVILPSIKFSTEILKKFCIDCCLGMKMDAATTESDEGSAPPVIDS